MTEGLERVKNSPLTLILQQYHKNKEIKESENHELRSTCEGSVKEITESG